uniref:Uncharacterized protein n=1 Tax=Rhizophora mucronata TaxID=61149 RepID=A0A2P2P347_RHIMU
MGLLPIFSKNWSEYSPPKKKSSKFSNSPATQLNLQMPNLFSPTS